MTRGNQRDLARERNLKKQKELKKGQPAADGTSLEQRKARDAEVMRLKQLKAEEKKQADAAGGSK